MRDEISFRSLAVKSNNEAPEDNINKRLIFNSPSERYLEEEENILEKKYTLQSCLSSNNNNSLLNIQNKNESKQNIVKVKIKEYFSKNKQLNKSDFSKFISFIGLSDIWSSEQEQIILWQSIINKAKNKDNIDCNAALSGICELFEDDDEEVEEGDELLDKKYTCYEKMSSSYLDVSTNENCIDEYLNSIKDNVKLLFAVKFINEIFLKNYLNNNSHYSINTINTMNVNNSIANGINYDLDKSDMDGDNEVIQIDNKFDKRTISINSQEIMNEIKNKYRFIIINNDELNTYFYNLAKNARKSGNSPKANEKKHEFCLDKELINYVSAMIELKIDSKIKTDENEDTNQNPINIFENNETKESSKSMIKEVDTKYNNKEIEAEFYGDIIEEFSNLDIIINDCYETIANFNKNNDLIYSIKLFNKNYILKKKKYLYGKLNKFFKKYLEQKTKIEELETKINEIKHNSQKAKICVVPNDENNYLRQQNENLKERNEYLQKENAELKENLSKNINEISKNNMKVSKLNLPNNNFPNNVNINFYSSRNPNANHLKNRTVGEENNLLNLINQSNQKNSQNNINTANISNSINDSNQNNSNNVNNTSTNKILLQLTKTNTNSFLDCNIEDLTNLTNSQLFSIVGNNVSNNNFLFETAELENEQNNPGTPTLTPRSNILDIKDENNSSYNNIIPNNSSLSDHEINIGKNLNIENNKKNNNDNNINKNNGVGIKIESKNSLNIDKFNDNKFSFAVDKNTGVSNIDLTIKFDKNCFYDFKYVSTNKKIGKLLLHNNEPRKSHEFFSDQIFYILNGNKRKKGLLLITSQCFYILDEINNMNCEIRISHTLLSSISIPQDNFNHLLLSFNEGSFIIIEIYRRIYLLNYLKDLYSHYNYKKISIYFCDKFNIKLNNNHSFFYDVKNNKEIILTPNFENAQKFGFLFKYKENIFSAYFTEKLVVLCSIGLIVFSKSNINIPILIIPLIGATIKYMGANNNDKRYCFKIKTANNGVFIFGSYRNKEVSDWIQELKLYQKSYENKMNLIMSNFVIKQNNI